MSDLDHNIEDEIHALDNPFLPNEDQGDEEVAVIPQRDQMFEIPSGKYKGLVLPRMLPIKPSYFDKVQALKDEITNDPDFQRYASTIARTYAKLRREAEAIGISYSDLKLRVAAAMLLMIDQFENEDETGLTLTSGDKIRWNMEPHLVVVDKEQFRQWCLSQHLERDMTLPWGKSNKLVKDMLREGWPEPPGTEVFARPKVTFTKAK